jgi:hypothetical protein
MKVQTVGSVSEFLRRQEEPLSVKVERHFKKYGFVYKAAGITIILLASGGTVFASDLDVEARSLYRELVRIGKWIIAFKGAFDILRALSDGDINAAKKTLISSLITFLILLGLPYGLDKVDKVFSRMANA